jgi:hypothetical protein
MNTATGAAGDLATTASEFVDTHEDGIVGLAMLFSAVVTMSGRTVLKPTVFMLGFFPTLCYALTVGRSVLCAQASGGACPTVAPIPALVVVASLILGVVAGVIMLRLLFALATFVITGASGAVVVLIVHVLLMRAGSSGDEVILFTVAVAAALLAGVLSLAYPETMIIVGTAFDGAAMAIFALAHFLGHEPDVLGTVTRGRSVLWNVAYATAAIMFGVYGTVIQMRVAASERPTPPAPRPDHRGEDAQLLPAYGSVENEFSKDALGAPPLLSYPDEEAGQS